MKKLFSMLPAAILCLAVFTGASEAATPNSGPAISTAPVFAEECTAVSMADCNDAAIQVGFDALNECPTPSDGQFFLFCDANGDPAMLLLVCDRSLIPIL
ncbi:hypothetical protein [Candidatus Palauibacter sp.]|uniref:hypothetical protein n=1 Tax=Candidatus Palauibacter sp. TaxID=3101350 RepID=UPI003B5BF98A